MNSKRYKEVKDAGFEMFNPNDKNNCLWAEVSKKLRSSFTAGVMWAEEHPSEDMIRKMMDLCSEVNRKIRKELMEDNDMLMSLDDLRSRQVKYILDNWSTNESKAEEDSDEKMDEVQAKIYEIIAEHFDILVFEVTYDSNIFDDLGADSLDVIELITKCEDEFDISIPDDDVIDIKTVGDIVNYVYKKMK